jgi:hypothetical protein
VSKTGFLTLKNTLLEKKTIPLQVWTVDAVFSSMLGI